MMLAIIVILVASLTNSVFAIHETVVSETGLPQGYNWSVTLGNITEWSISSHIVFVGNTSGKIKFDVIALSNSSTALDCTSFYTPKSASGYIVGDSDNNTVNFSNSTICKTTFVAIGKLSSINWKVKYLDEYVYRNISGGRQYGVENSTYGNVLTVITNSGDFPTSISYILNSSNITEDLFPHILGHITCQDFINGSVNQSGCYQFQSYNLKAGGIYHISFYGNLTVSENGLPKGVSYLFFNNSFYNMMNSSLELPTKIGKTYNLSFPQNYIIPGVGCFSSGYSTNLNSQPGSVIGSVINGTVFGSDGFGLNWYSTNLNLQSVNQKNTSLSQFLVDPVTNASFVTLYYEPSQCKVAVSESGLPNESSWVIHGTAGGITGTSKTLITEVRPVNGSLNLSISSSTLTYSKDGCIYFYIPNQTTFRFNTNLKISFVTKQLCATYQSSMYPTTIKEMGLPLSVSEYLNSQFSVWVSPVLHTITCPPTFGSNNGYTFGGCQVSYSNGSSAIQKVYSYKPGSSLWAKNITFYASSGNYSFSTYNIEYSPNVIILGSLLQTRSGCISSNEPNYSTGYVESGEIKIIDFYSAFSCSAKVAEIVQNSSYLSLHMTNFIEKGLPNNTQWSIVYDQSSRNSTVYTVSMQKKNLRSISFLTLPGIFSISIPDIYSDSCTYTPNYNSTYLAGKTYKLKFDSNCS